MNTIADIIAFNREHASRHLHESDGRWQMAGTLVAAFFVLWMVCAYVR